MRKVLITDRRKRGLRDRIVKAIEDSGLDQKEVAAILEIREATISGWVSKKDASIPLGHMLLRLPEALGVCGHWLLTGEGSQKPPSRGDRPVSQEELAFRQIESIVLELRASEDEDDD